MTIRDLETYPQFNGFNPQYFFDELKPFRKRYNEKGILTFPFDFGYKLANDTQRYGKKIIPWGRWKGVQEIVKPNETRPHNYAVMTGKVNKFLVIDYDFPKLDEGEEDGLDWLKSVLPEEHNFWNTYRVKTGSGGQHFYLKYDERLKIGTTRCIYLNGVKSKISLDMRTDGNCVIGEKSVNESGSYNSINNTTIDDILEIPEELMPFLIKPQNPVNIQIHNQNVINLTPQTNNNNISEDKIKWINCLEGHEYLFNSHEAWWNLAKICATYYNFEYFLNISQKAEGFTSIEDCRSKFEDARNHPVNFGLLVNLIKDNLPLVYHENFGYINKNIYKGDEEGFNQIIFHTYKDKFKFDADNSIWYECVEGLWFKRDKENLVLRRLIAEEMINIFRKKDFYLTSEILKVSQNTELESEEKAKKVKELESLREIINTQISWCRKNNKRAEFVKSVRDMFYDYEFITKLDSIKYSGHIFSFNNGYINLNEYHENKTIVFHRHKPENYISMTCGYDYIPKSDIPIDILNKVYNTIDSIMPDEEDRKYLLQSLSTCMTAGNDNEVIITCYGKTGGNGKGVLLTNLMSYVFGNYAGTYKTSNIVGKKTIDAESASSGLASIMNCRYVYMTEPDKEEELNNDALKLLSGGDELNYRKLHENMTKRTPAFTLFLQANHILNADSYDEAVWRRLKYIHFNQTFRVNPNLEKGEKQADITLKKKFLNDLNYRQAFIHLLLENYDPILKDTEKIKQYINEARSDCDFIQEYIEGNIQETNEEDSEFLWNYGQLKFITFNELKKRYKKWYKENYDEEDKTKPADLKKIFIQKLSNFKKTYKTKMFERSFDNEIQPITTNGRQKQKNWGASFTGYKFTLSIEEEDEEEENSILDI